MRSSNEILKWLLEGDPWVEYRTRLDLLKQTETQPEVICAREAMLTHPKIQSLLQELQNWPGIVISSHKSAGQQFHKLSFIADLGLTKKDPYMEGIIKKVFEYKTEEGPFGLPTNVPVHFGGSGKTEWAWALCDAPINVYALAKFGLHEDLQVKKAAKYLANLVRDNGWPCAVSKELGKFRGPGRKDEPCPYATLVMLKLLLQFDDFKDGKEAHIGTECLLNLWSKSRELHPYIFYMGTDFRKLKAPFIWYDIVHVLDTLSQFSWLKADSRLQDMVQVVTSKVDREGKFKPESEWTAWKGWDFGQKKEPSRWLTFLVYRILSRLE